MIKLKVHIQFHDGHAIEVESDTNEFLIGEKYLWIGNDTYFLTTIREFMVKPVLD